MRKISQKKFWNTVRRRNSKKAKDILAIFDESKVKKLRSVHGVRHYLLHVALPAYVDAAKMNGCRRGKTIRAYYGSAISAAEHFLGDNVAYWKDFKKNTPAQIQKKYWGRIATLSRLYARRRQCHGLKEGFVCYCDER